MRLLRDRIAAASVSSIAALLAFLHLVLPLACAPTCRRGDEAHRDESGDHQETALQRIQKTVANINSEASTPEGEEAVVNRLSKQFPAPQDTLRAQQQMWGLGYGEVAMVYGFRERAEPR